jgi:hypothetical protein
MISQSARLSSIDTALLLSIGELFSTVALNEFSMVAQNQTRIHLEGPS